MDPDLTVRRRALRGGRRLRLQCGKGRELLANYFEFLDGWTFFSSGKLGYLKRDSLRAGVTVSDDNWGHLCRD